MDSVKRLEKILLQLERLQTPIDRLRRQLEFLKREDNWEAVTADKLEQAIQKFEWETDNFRQEILFGYGQIAPGRAELTKRFAARSK